MFKRILGKKKVPPVVVFADKNSKGEEELLVVEGANRTAAAKELGVELEADVIKDENYKVGKTSIIDLILIRIFGVRNKK